MKLNYIPLLAILLIGVVFVSGCVQQTTTPSETGEEKIKYVCQDGTIVDNPDLCPKPTTNVSAPCTENWSCSDWSVCKSDGTQTRTCIDSNNCGTVKNKPPILQSCVYQQQLDKIQLKSKLEDISCNTGELITSILYENNIMYIEGTDSRPLSASYVTSQVYDCMQKRSNVVIEYLNQLQIKPQTFKFKEIIECDSIGSLDLCDGLKSKTFITTLSWDDTEKLGNLEMSYSEWLVKTQVSEQ